MKCSLFAWDQFPLLMSHVSPNELESLVHEAEEAAGAGYDAVVGGAAAPATRPTQEEPRAKCAKCAFAGDVDVSQAVSESYEKWAQWRDHVAATFRAFLYDDLAAKKAGEYHVELMHRGLDQAGVDIATEWAAPLAESHEALLMMALYENQARWRLDVVTGEWRHINHPARAPPQGTAPRPRRPLIRSAPRLLPSRPDCRSSRARWPRSCR